MHIWLRLKSETYLKLRNLAFIVLGEEVRARSCNIGRLTNEFFKDATENNPNPAQRVGMLFFIHKTGILQQEIMSLMNWTTDFTEDDLLV